MSSSPNEGISNGEEKEMNMHPLLNSNRKLLPRQPRPSAARRNVTSGQTREDGSYCSSSGGSSIGSRTKRGRHRRVLSAVEGSVAQEKLLHCMEGLDLSGLTTEGLDPNMMLSPSGASLQDASADLNLNLHKGEDDIASNTDATNNSVTNKSTLSDMHFEAENPSMTASALSDWNTAAQSKAPRVALPTPPEEPMTDLLPPEISSETSFEDEAPNVTPQWHHDDNDEDGLITNPHVMNGNASTATNHPHFPMVANINDGASSVGATATFSNSSLRSIMSQYSSDLEDEEDPLKGKDDHFGEEGDLMGELLPHMERKKKERATCRNCSRMQQIEHQRRMLNETQKISSRKFTPSPNPTPTNNPYNQILTQQPAFSPPSVPSTLDFQKLLQTEFTKFQSDLQSQTQLQFEKLFQYLQSENQKRNAIEHRLKHQLLLQSESMIAMELKLVRLEAKVERKERNFRKTVRSSNTTSNYRRMAEETAHENEFPPMILANVEEVREDEDDSENSSEPPHDKKNLKTEKESENHGNDDEVEEDDTVSDTKESASRSKKVLKIKVAASSGASLVSAVTAMSGEGYDGLEEEETVDPPNDGQEEDIMEEDEVEGADTLTLGTWGSSSIIERTNPGLSNRGRGRYRGVRAVVTGIATEGDDSSENTPTQSSNRHIPNLESILLNPLVLNNSNHSTAESMANTTRAIRGPPDPANNMEDENSTLATSVTSATWTSTVVTGATSLLNTNTSRGGSHITGAIGEHSSYNTDHTHEENDQSSKEVIHISLKEGEEEDNNVRQRDQSNSPLTVPSMSGLASIASSVGTTLATGSMVTTAAVAPSRSFRSRRAAAAATQLANYGIRDREGVIPSHVKTNRNPTRNLPDMEEDIQKDGEEIASRRSRSNSPLTLPSMGGINSVAPSLSGTSINATSLATAATTGAVAPSRDFRSRRAAAAAHLAASAVNERAGSTSIANNTNTNPQPPNLIIGGVGVLSAGNPRPLTNRVVSFVHSSEDAMNVSGSEDMEGAQVVFTGGSMGGSILRGEMDSLTVPEELDNLSDIDAAFANSSVRWREEYEARLDAIQKRWSNA